MKWTTAPSAQELVDDGVVVANVFSTDVKEWTVGPRSASMITRRVWWAHMTGMDRPMGPYKTRTAAKKSADASLSGVLKKGTQ